MKSIKLKELLKESENTRLNKKVLKFFDGYINLPKGLSEYQWVFKTILKGALTDANFHSEVKKVDKLFPRSSRPSGKDGSPYTKELESVIEDKGIMIAKWAKWDGFDIINAFSYVASMRINDSAGKKIETLLENSPINIKEELKKGEIHSLEGKQVKYSVILNDGTIQIHFKDGASIEFMNNKYVKIKK